MKAENTAPNARRTLAVGWFDNAPFREICEKYANRIKEVFFAWPGVAASRPMAPWTPERRELICSDLAWCRANGIELDAIAATIGSVVVWLLVKSNKQRQIKRYGGAILLILYAAYLTYRLMNL